MTSTQLMDVFFCGHICWAHTLREMVRVCNIVSFLSPSAVKKKRRQTSLLRLSKWMWPWEFIQPFQKPQKGLNKGWEIFYLFSEKFSFSENPKQLFSKTPAKCFCGFIYHFSSPLSHTYRGLFKYPSATLVHPPSERNTINHAVTQSTHQC